MKYQTGCRRRDDGRAATAIAVTPSESVPRRPQRALKTVLAGRTSPVIAHRLHTIPEVREILVIDSGQIRALGSRAELLLAAFVTTEP